MRIITDYEVDQYLEKIGSNPRTLARLIIAKEEKIKRLFYLMTFIPGRLNRLSRDDLKRDFLDSRI